MSVTTTQILSDAKVANRNSNIAASLPLASTPSSVEHRLPNVCIPDIPPLPVEEVHNPQPVDMCVDSDCNNCTERTDLCRQMRKLSIEYELVQVNAYIGRPNATENTAESLPSVNTIRSADSGMCHGSIDDASTSFQNAKPNDASATSNATGNSNDRFTAFISDPIPTVAPD